MRRARTGIVIAAAVLGAAFAGCSSGDPAPASKPPVPPAATGPGWKVVPAGSDLEYSGLNDIDILDAENIWVASENVPEEEAGEKGGGGDSSVIMASGSTASKRMAGPVGKAVALLEGVVESAPTAATASAA